MKSLLLIILSFTFSSCAYLSGHIDDEIKAPVISRSATLNRSSLRKSKLTPVAPIKSTTLKKQLSEKPLEINGDEKTRELSSVEIILADAADIRRYHLHYGFSKNKLNRHLQISAERLEKIKHPTLGKLRRFMLHGVPSGKKIYYTMQSENRFGRSKASPLQVVEGR